MSELTPTEDIPEDEGELLDYLVDRGVRTVDPCTQAVISGWK